MLKYFVWVTRDLVTSGILLSIFFAFAGLFDTRNLKRESFRFNRKAILTGILIGLAGALFIAFVKQNNLIRDRKLLVVNLYLLGTMFVSSIFYILFQMGLLTQNFPKADGIAKGISGGICTATILAYVLPTFFLYPFNFLIKGQNLFSTDFLFKSIGFLLGTIFIFLIALSFYKIIKNPSQKSARLVASILLILNIAHRIGKLISPMVVRRWIKLPKGFLHFIDFLSNNEAGIIILFTLIASISAFVLIYKAMTNNEPYSNPAEHRKIRAKCRNQKRWSFSFLLFVAFTIFTLTYLKKQSENVVVLSPAEPFEMEGDTITIPFSQVNDGLLHRFEYKSGDVGIRFIIIQKNAYAYGIGFDACEICGATGYYQKNGQVICKLCDVIMNINTIGFKGGCNPIPLPYEIKDGMILIKTSDLEVEKRRFR